MQHIGLYLLQALSPSPQIDMKFNSQKEEPVNGNDFVHNSFGGKPAISKRRHRHFKSFFASNDPTNPVPSRDEAPNWKFHPCLLLLMAGIPPKRVHLLFPFQTPRRIKKDHGYF